MPRNNRSPRSPRAPSTDRGGIDLIVAAERTVGSIGGIRADVSVEVGIDGILRNNRLSGSYDPIERTASFDAGLGSARAKLGGEIGGEVTLRENGSIESIGGNISGSFGGFGGGISASTSGSGSLSAEAFGAKIELARDDKGNASMSVCYGIGIASVCSTFTRDKGDPQNTGSLRPTISARPSSARSRRPNLPNAAPTPPRKKPEPKPKAEKPKPNPRPKPEPKPKPVIPKKPALNSSSKKKPAADITKKPSIDIRKKPPIDLGKKPAVDIRKKPSIDLKKKPSIDTKKKPTDSKLIDLKKPLTPPKNPKSPKPVTPKTPKSPAPKRPTPAPKPTPTPKPKRPTPWPRDPAPTDPYPPPVPPAPKMTDPMPPLPVPPAPKPPVPPAPQGSKRCTYYYTYKTITYSNQGDFADHYAPGDLSYIFGEYTVQDASGTFGVHWNNREARYNYAISRPNSTPSQPQAITGTSAEVAAFIAANSTTYSYTQPGPGYWDFGTTYQARTLTLVSGNCPLGTDPNSNPKFNPPRLPNTPQKIKPMADCCAEIKEIHKYLGIAKMKKKFKVAKAFLSPGGTGNQECEDYYAITEALFRMLANGLIINPTSKPLGNEWKSVNATAWAQDMYEMMAEAMSDGNSTQKYEISSIMQLTQLLSILAELSRKVDFLSEAIGATPDLEEELIPACFTIYEGHKGFEKKQPKKIDVTKAKTDDDVEAVLAKMLKPSQIPIVRWVFRPDHISIIEALKGERT
ncbi:hypothetical protein QUA56_08090 [Microcoleus sp. N3A4]|uniref:hypothetical protein n=1 Tax=Microcoleus sp. N3A4 TaxID=3055379 RepID=UPI002FD6A2D2